METLDSLSEELRTRFSADQEKAQWLYAELKKAFGMPVWRSPMPAIDELISTILSQNTNDHNRDIAFERLRKRFPTWDAVCDADVDDVIDAIRPAGLGNQKGRRIQAVLQQIRREHQTLDLDFLKGWEQIGRAHV